MSKDELKAQEDVHRARVLICRARFLSAEDSVRALADQASDLGISEHAAALRVLDSLARGKDLL